MSTPFKIVVPTDFSDASLAIMDWVKKIATEQKAEVHCITVVHQPMIYMPMMAGAATTPIPTTDQLSQLSQDSLRIFIEKHMHDLGTKPIEHVVVGRPANEIVAYAANIDADMIIIATRGHSPIAHTLLGSTTEAVVRSASCPVLAVRSEE